MGLKFIKFVVHDLEIGSKGTYKSFLPTDNLLSSHHVEQSETCRLRDGKL